MKTIIDLNKNTKMHNRVKKFFADLPGWEDELQLYDYLVYFRRGTILDKRSKRNK